MMCQLTSLHGSSMVCHYLLAICWHHPPAKQKALHHRGCNLTVTFRQELYWLGYGWSSAWLNCLILWNMCDIASYLLNNSMLVTIQLGHGSSSQYWHHNIRSKDHLHWGSAERLLKNRPCWGLNCPTPCLSGLCYPSSPGLNRRHLWSSDQFKHESCSYR